MFCCFFFLMIRRPPRSTRTDTLFPYTTLFRSGTHARFAIATIDGDGTIALSHPETLHTSDHASFQTEWEDYRERMGGKLPGSVAMAVAGPVKQDVIRFTNNPWIIRPPLIASKLGCERFTIVNDFEAVAHAVAN